MDIYIASFFSVKSSNQKNQSSDIFFDENKKVKAILFLENNYSLI